MAKVTRRTALGLSAGVAGAAVLGVEPPAAADPTRAGGSGPERIRRAYRREKTRAGGVWNSHVAIADRTGRFTPVVEDNPDPEVPIFGYSVQKLAVATAVMDKIDRKLLGLDTKLELPNDPDFMLDGSGIYHLHGVWGDQITVANFLTAMLLVSDNTAVRMCGKVVPALELNAILDAKGFRKTRVRPVADPNRFFLGTTTPLEMHDLLRRLANRTLLSPASCDFLLRILRWVSGYHDGIRRNMSSDERSRVATKYGALFDETGAARHEVGIMFGTNGSPVLTYALFAGGLPDVGNYGATHPAVQAHAVLGRTMLDVVNTTAVPATTPKHHVPRFRQVDTA